MALKHSVYDTDPHFTIDPVTRNIINTSDGKTTLIQGDHNSERFTFELPRYIDGHDMSLCDRVQVHYINIDQGTKESNADVYEPDDVQVYPEDENVVVLSWLISKNATQFVGSLSFALRFICLEGDTVIYSWNTSPHKGVSVSTGINCSEAVVEEYSDVLEQWRQELEEAAGSGGGGSGGGSGTSADGKSAYEIAVENGFKGTEAEWLESLAIRITSTEEMTSTEDGGTNTTTFHFSDGGQIIFTYRNGSKGASGDSVTIDESLTEEAADGSYTILHFTDGSQLKVTNGKDGATPNFTIGTVTTLEAGSNATVEITGTAENPVLNFGIPRGEGGNSADEKATYISLPESANVKVGNELKIYYRNILSRDDVVFWVGYNNSLTTRYYDEYLSIIATAEGTYPLPWKVYDKGSNLICSGDFNIIATAKVPTDTTKALVIGDSTVNADTMTDKAKALYTADGAALTLLGTRGNGHEGRGGWTAEMYCTLASSGDITNPFYNNGFDFSYYMNNQGYSEVQAVAIQLGINDIFAFKDYDWALYDSTEVLEYINQMVTSILAYDGNIKVVINLPTTPNSNGTSFTEAYGTTQLYWTYNRNIIHFAEELISYFANNTSVTISASNCILDTKTQIRDGVHPTEDGYNALGQRLYEVLISITDGGIIVIPLLDISKRTRVVHSGNTIAAASVHELDETKCYDTVMNGIRSTGCTSAITSYTPKSNNSFVLNQNFCSGNGIEFPVPSLEVGKTYTINYTVDVAARLYLMKYTSEGVYSSNTALSTKAGTYSETITPESGYIYSLCFCSFTENVDCTFSGISLVEN